MAETHLAARPAFGDALPTGRLGRLGGTPGIVVRELVWLGAAMLMARPNATDALSDTLRPLDLALPAPRRWTEAPGWQALWLGPERWLVVGPADAAARLTRHAGAAADVVDQSDARAALTLRGPAARELLSRIVTIDPHPRAFRPGDVAATTAGHVAAVLWQIDESPSFGIAVARSYAGSLAEWLIESAAGFGLLVEA